MAFRRSSVPGEDIKLGLKMAEKRRQLIDETPAEPLKYEYGVNRLSKALHPGIMKALICKKEECSPGCVKITLKSLREDGRFPYFRAGQFVTLSCPVKDSFLSRPYSIASSPKRALEGYIDIIVQKKGIFSSYLIEDAAPESELWVSEPSGDFCYDNLRDRNHIIAIAGGSGITPFLSMMSAICEGSEDFRLTLIYGVRTRNHLLFNLNDYKDERIEIMPVLSDEEAEGYRHGFINADILKEYLSDKCSVFMCGPDAMYEFVNKQLISLGFDMTRVRQERNSVGDREIEEVKLYKLTVRIRDEVYHLSAFNNETLVTAMERAGIPAPVRCRNGVCGFCHSRVVKGEYYVREKNDFRRSADKIFGYIHPCCTYPLSDMEIDVPVFEL